jgi:hypothetical protein
MDLTTIFSTPFMHADRHALHFGTAGMSRAPHTIIPCLVFDKGTP